LRLLKCPVTLKFIVLESLPTHVGIFDM